MSFLLLLNYCKKKKYTECHHSKSPHDLVNTDERIVEFNSCNEIRIHQAFVFLATFYSRFTYFKEGGKEQVRDKSGAKCKNNIS